MRAASPLRRALAIATATGLLSTGFLVGSGTVAAAAENLTVSPLLASNDSDAMTALTLTTTGTSFQTGATVVLTHANDSAFTIENDGLTTANPFDTKQLAANVTLTREAPGPYNVTVTNPGPSGATYSCSGCFTVTGPFPTVTSIARTANASTHTLSGSNFARGTSVAFKRAGALDENVKFSGTTTNGTTIVGALEVKPAFTGGSYDIVVTNTDGKSATCTGCLVIPKITSVWRADQSDGTPAQLGYGVSSKNLVVKGQGFTAGTAFGFGPAVSGDTNLVSINSKSFDAATGLVTLNVTVRDPSDDPIEGDPNDPSISADYALGASDTGGGGFTKAMALKVNPRPALATNPYNFDNPGQAYAGDPMVLTGSGFQTNMTVAFTPADGIVPQAVTVNSPTQATFPLTVAATTPLTAHNLVLTNPDFGTNTGAKTLTPSAAPSITGLSPAAVSVGQTSATLTFSGSGFCPSVSKNGGTAARTNEYATPRIVVLAANGTDLRWTSGAVTCNNTYTTATATLQIPANQASGSYRVALLSNNGSLVECKTASNGPCFTLDALGVDAVSPNVGTNDESAKQLTISGSGFAAGAVPRLQRAGQPDIVGTAINVTSSSSLTANFDLRGAAPGNNAWSVRVTNTDGSTGQKANSFSIGGFTPRITSFPSELGAGNPALKVLVTGTNLSNGATLVFSTCGLDDSCNPQVVSSKRLSDTQMEFVLNTTAATAGPRGVQVRNTNGATSPTSDCPLIPVPDCTTVNAAPVVDAVAPANRSAGSLPFTLTLEGSGFAGTPKVEISGGGLAVGTPTLVDDTTITVPVTVAADAVQSARDVTLTNGDGGQVTKSGAFTVLAPPTITSVSPGFQKVGTGPTTVTVTGNRFAPTGVTVTFGPGVTAGTAAVAGDGKSFTVPVTVAADASPRGLRDVTVTNRTTARTSQASDTSPDAGTATLTNGFGIGDVPSAPQGLTATRGNSVVNLAWNAPASDGGLAISSYSVTATLPDGSAVVPAPTITVADRTAQVTGLTNGTQYKFDVRAVNGVGSGPAATAFATPATVPGAPTNASATPGDGQATISWTAPANGGSAITSYKVVQTGGLTKNAPANATSFVFTGLTNGVSTTFSVIAVNAVGDSTASNTTNAVTPKSAKPAPPTNLTGSVTAAAGQVDLSWTAPDNNASLTPVTSYTVYLDPGHGTATYPADRTATTAKVTGLVNGQAYKIVVGANNSAGSSSPSNLITVTPYTVPSAVTSLAVTPGNQKLTATWAAPASNGGRPVTGYTASISPAAGGSQSLPAGTTSAVFTGLTNGTTYTITVKATNLRGDGPGASVAGKPAPAASAITLAAPAARVLRGTPITLKGTVTRQDTSVPIGKVRLFAVDDAGVTRTLAFVTPTAAGAYSYSFTPVYNGRYRATYPADARNAGSASVFRRNLVAAKLSVQSPTGPATSIQVIRGGVLPNKAGFTVTLYRVTSNGTLVRLATAKVNSSSVYEFRVRLARGSHNLMVGIPATGTGTAKANDRGEIRFIARRT